jgi:hypothetical protein
MKKLYRTLAVTWQMDIDSPVETGIVRYHVSALETEIFFPTKVLRTFNNWDVKGVRKASYEDRWVNVPAEELLNAMSVEAHHLMEYGITPDDVRRFIADLAKKPVYEKLFWQPSPALPTPSEEFEQIVQTLAQGATA